MKFIELFHKSFDEFHENRIKKEEVSADADLEFTDGVISDVVSKIVARFRSLINLDGEVEKKDEEGSKHKSNFLKAIDNFFHSFFNSTKKTQWHKRRHKPRGGIKQEET